MYDKNNDSESREIMKLQGIISNEMLRTWYATVVKMSMSILKSLAIYS